MSPLEYVHTLRLEEAKQMLEAGDQPIEAIANEAGYEDAGFFSRLFRRKGNMTPAQYRKRFGSLRKVLEGSVSATNGGRREASPIAARSERAAAPPRAAVPPNSR